MVVACVYRLPDSDLQLFLNVVDSFLTKMRTFKKVIVSGDFNVRFGTADVRDGGLCDMFASYGYCVTVNDPTRQNNCLDNISRVSN